MSCEKLRSKANAPYRCPYDTHEHIEGKDLNDYRD